MKNIIVMLGLFLITSCSTGSKSVLGDEDRWDRRDRRERDDRRDRRDDWDDDDDGGIHVDL
jgi:hypothetical protein